MNERGELTSLEDRTMAAPDTIAVVTGGNRGIGLEICRQLAAKGIHVILTARDLEKAREAADKLAGPGARVTAHALDVTSPQSAESFARAMDSTYGHVDVLINNA